MSSLRTGISSLKDKLLLVFRPAVSASLVLSGAYVSYINYSRWRRMMRTYERGNILPPFKENHFEVKYFKRTEVEGSLKPILQSEFTNSYYLVNGEVGCGKTRTLIEITRELMRTSGGRREGAPIYVAFSQGKCLGDTLADAVNFRFDEHISFSSFLDYMLKIRSFPSRDDHNKLLRVLDAIEESAFTYMQQTGRPVVLVIDGIGLVESEHPKALRKLQDKAKLWADTNTVKVVFVTNEDRTELALQQNHSNWSRAATPVTIGDLSENEAVDYLTTVGLLEADKDGQHRQLDRGAAKAIYSQVGGRIHHLIVCKREFNNGVPLEITLARLRVKERAKFLSVAGNPSMWKAIKTLRNAPGNIMNLQDLIAASDKETVIQLTQAHIVKVERLVGGIKVQFESVITESVVDDFYE